MKENKQLQKLITRRDSYKRMYGVAEGKVVLDELMEYCKVYDLSMGATPEVTAFNEGRRSVGLHILHILGQNDKALEYITKKLEEQYNNQIQNEEI